jgi:hypothetical protein
MTQPRQSTWMKRTTELSGRRLRSPQARLAHPERGAARALLGQDMIFINTGKIENTLFFNALCSLKRGYLSPVTRRYMA